MTKRKEISFRAFVVEDLDRFDLLDDEKETIIEGRPLLQKLENLTKLGSNKCFAMTIFLGDTPLYFGAFYEISPGVAQTFIVPDKRIFENRKAFIRSAMVWLRFVQSLPWCHRIQTFSLPFKRINKWMKVLGFTCEGQAKSYTKSGQSYNLWSRVKVDGVWN